MKTIKRNKEKLTRSQIAFTAVRVIMFVALPFLMSILMFFRVSEILHTYMENRIKEDTVFLGKMLSQHLTSRMESLCSAAEFFADGKIPEEDMGQMCENLTKAHDRLSCGILRIDGTAVYGEPLTAADYPAVRAAFRGKSTVRYRSGDEFFFTAPIYNGENIKYVIYEFVDRTYLFHSAELDFYGGAATMALSEREQGLIISVTPGTDISELRGDGVRAKFNDLYKKMGLDTAAAVYENTSDFHGFWFICDINIGNLLIIGKMPYDAVASGVETLAFIAFLVNVMLLGLLSIGTFSILDANSKLRESDALREAKKMAEEASRSKSEFLANMSHELRTPINVILGMDEMILREDPARDTKERAMDIKSAASILLSLINDILDFSKIESGKMNIILADYSFVAVIRDLALMTENRARQKSLNFVMDIDPALPEKLRGDDIHIRQVVVNLLTNAVKYTNDGTVALRVSEKSRSGDKIVLHFVVSDTGIGIKPQDIEKLMIPYTRIEEERNRNVEGTGLGMSIIINLLKLMDSRLNIESVYGEGSTFWFDIEQTIIDPAPVGNIRKRIEDMADDYKYKAFFTAPDARVLMVDDNSMNRKIFASLLTKTKISVTTVSSGRQCLEIVESEKFDIIFMDHLMPEMDGIETLERLKKLEKNMSASAPVVALTANAFSGDREYYIGLGFTDFLPKPIATDKLEALIVKLLPPELVNSAEDEDVREAAEELPEDALPEIRGVNYDIARLHLGTDELILQSLKDFYRSIDVEIRDISALCRNIDEEGDFSDYRIRVHALKSTSALVGIMGVSELARLLEFAARAGERGKIGLLQPFLIEELEKMKEQMSVFAAENDEKLPLPEGDFLAEQLEKLREALSSMNIGEVDEITAQLGKYSYPDDIQPMIDELCEKAASLDYEAAGQLAERLNSLG